MEYALAREVRDPDLVSAVDRFLLYISEKTEGYLSPVAFNHEAEYVQIGQARPDLARDVREAAIIGGQLRRNPTSLTPLGWRRVHEIREGLPDSRKAFVAMWFDPSMDGAYKDGFKVGLEATKYFQPIRISEKEHNGKIDDEIVAEIRTSGLLVADFTGNRGGVYFEAGLAMGLGIPVIWTCREDFIGEVHFDTRQYNHIVWKAADDLAKSLRDRVLATIPAATKR